MKLKLKNIKEHKDFFYQKLINCSLCPRKCGINRLKEEGFCKLKGNRIPVSSICVHYGEEPAISGTNGSGTVFFSNCNMQCIYCQNIDISDNSKANLKYYSYKELAKEFIKLQKLNCNNINLVSPTPHIAQIIITLELAYKMGLNIPIVYNTNLYDDLEVLKNLEGLIDVYLPDFKYSNNMLSKKYSFTSNYFDIAKENIKELFRQTKGELIFASNEIANSGIILRHLILPGEIINSKEVLLFLKDNVNNNIHLSLMSQYNPNINAKKYGSPLNRSLYKDEYETVKDYALELGFSNGWFQDLDSKDTYNPDFSKENPFS